MTFHSLSHPLFSQFTWSSQKGEAVTTAGCTTCSSWSLQMLCIIPMWGVTWCCLGKVKAEKIGVYCLLCWGLLRSQWLQSPELDGLHLELGYHRWGLLGQTSCLCTLKIPLCLSSATGWVGWGTGPSEGLTE